MSYNTRRANIGRGGQTTQVNYHQSMSGRPGHRGGGYNQSNYSQPAYSTQQGYSSQQKAVQPPQVSKAPSPAPTPVPVAAPVSTPAPVLAPPPASVPTPVSAPAPTPVAPPAAQQATQPQPATPTPVPPPAQNTSPAEAKPAVKAEPMTPSPLPTPAPQQISTMDVDTNGEGGGGDSTTPKPHWVRRGPSFKVSKKIKRRRMNARLRRLLIPKNALMVLNELHPGVKFSVQEQKNALHQYFCTVQVEVEGKTYSGQGISRMLAKQTACENALKGLLLEKLAKVDQEQQPSKLVTNESGTKERESFNEEDDIEMEEDKNTSGGEGDSVSVVSDSRPRRSFPEDDVPWGSLASFALHKLFTEWQSQGTEVPVAKIISTPLISPETNLPQVTGAPSPMKKIPDDANKRHPVQLLNQLRPGCQYKETREGNVPTLTFTISVNIDGVEYSGVGSTKKEAKKKCAQAALAPMGVIFDN